MGCFSIQILMNQRKSSLRGAHVTLLLHGYQLTGDHIMTLDVPSLTSGGYIYRLHAKAMSTRRKILLIT